MVTFRDIIDILVAMSVPSALTAFFFWLLERRIQKRESEHAKERDEAKEEAQRLEEIRAKNEIIIIESVDAAVELCTATARAVQRIPDAHCNGDMDAALRNAADVKQRHKEFLTDQGIHAMY